MDSSDIITYGSYITLNHDLGTLYASGFIEESLSFSTSDPLKSVFRVLPQCIYTTQEALLLKTASPDFPSQYSRMKPVLEGEISTNISTSASYLSQPLTYGSPIQLQHTYSKKFLTFSLEKHEFRRDQFKLVLSDFGSEMSVLSIQSAHKYQEEGSSFIKSGSKVVVGAKIKEIDKIAYIDKCDDIQDVTASLEDQLPLAIVSYSVDVPKLYQLAAGDCVNLIITERELGSGTYEENSCLIGLKNEYQKNFIEPRLSSNHSDINGVWVIENIKSSQGGLLKTGQCYTLRHVASGQYLNVEENKLSFTICPLDAGWKIINRDNNELIYSEKFYRIIHHNTNQTLGGEYNENLSTGHLIPTLSIENSTTSYFRLKKCTEHFSSATFFLVSCQDFLSSFIEDINQIYQNSLKNVNTIQYKFSLLKKCLLDIESFCKNQLQKLISVDVPDGEIDTNKQNILRDLKFISGLTVILDIFSYQKNYKIYSPEVKKIFPNEIRNILIAIFKLITVVCQDNKENQLEAFYNISTYCKYLNKNVGANDFLISLMKNNPDLLYRIADSYKSELISVYIYELRVINI